MLAVLRIALIGWRHQSLVSSAPRQAAVELSRTRILSIAGGLISRAARLGDDDSSCAVAILIRDSRLRAAKALRSALALALLDDVEGT